MSSWNGKKDEAIKLFEQGMSSNSVSDELGVPYQTCYCWRKAWDKENPPTKRTDSEMKSMEEVIKEGMKNKQLVSEICKEHGFDYAAACLIVAKMDPSSLQKMATSMKPDEVTVYSEDGVTVEGYELIEPKREVTNVVNVVKMTDGQAERSELEDLKLKYDWLRTESLNQEQEIAENNKLNSELKVQLSEATEQLKAYAEENSMLKHRVAQLKESPVEVPSTKTGPIREALLNLQANTVRRENEKLQATLSEQADILKMALDLIDAGL